MIAGFSTVIATAGLANSSPQMDSGDRATLELTITGVRDQDGVVYLAVYDRPEAFPKTDGMRAKVQAEVSDSTLTVSIPDLPSGRYAVAAYHDQNGNGTFDQGLFGIPLEGYGFTGNPRVFPSGPTFDDAAITVTPPLTRAELRMRY